MPDKGQSRAEEILNKLPLPVYVKDRNGNFTFVNEAFANIKRMPAKDLLGKTDRDFYDISFATKFQQDDRSKVQ